jgi:ubiquinone/menaquinone biosynthesis C-methylase UbiE
MLQDVERLVVGDLLAQHARFNDDFLRAGAPALRRYARQWGGDPLKLWSRRWEYPFVGQRIVDHLSMRAGPWHVLDAGSGVTYFPYYLARRMGPPCRVTCVDSNRAYGPIFEAIDAQRPGSNVRFVAASLQDLPLEDRSVDAVSCISVLEHTDRHDRILDQFARVLRSGGLLALTFDLSLDGRFELSRRAAERLLAAVGERFALRDGDDPRAMLGAMDQPDRILTTDHVRRTQPQLLPWRWPWLLAVRDLLRGRGWTGGFKSKTVFCLDVLAR